MLAVRQSWVEKQKSSMQLFCLASVISLILNIPIVGAAENLTVDVYGLDQIVDLNPYVEFIEDKDHRFTLNEMREGKYDELWQSNQGSYLLGTHARSRYWFRVKLAWHSTAAAKAILYFAVHPTFLVRIGLDLARSQNTDDSARETIETGWIDPISKQHLSQQHYGFIVELKPNSSQTLLGWTSNSVSELPAVIPLFLLAESEFNRFNIEINRVLVAFYAIMGTLLIYNSCLFIFLRQSVYGIYVIFLLSAVGQCAFVDGSSLFWLFPENPLLNYRCGFAGGVIMAMMYMAFVVHALDKLRTWPKIEVTYYSLLAVGAMVFLYNIVTSQLPSASTMAQMYAAIAGTYSLGLIVAGVIKDIPTAKYLGIAELMTLAGASIFMLSVHSILPINQFTFWALHWGLAGEALLLSLALAARTRIAQQEKIVADAKNQAKSQFFASMNHELRTPLTAILGYADAALGEAVSPQEQQDALQTISRSGRHLLQIVNDILDISKLEAQKLAVENLAVDLPSLLLEIKDYFFVIAKQKSLVFEITPMFPLPKTIVSDPTRLKQILINLCANAFKFTERGGVILEINCDPGAEKIRFVVVDTGIGLKLSQVEHLFEAFVQADVSTARHYGGSGLGLHLSKKLAQALGGDIQVNTAYGHGCQFTVDVSTGALDQVEWLLDLNGLNLAHMSLAHRRVSHADNQPKRLTGRKISVLLAEDNLDIQNLIKLQLKRAGAEVTGVYDGAEALVQALTNEFDLILMDMQMPIMGGIEAVEKLRAKGYKKPIYALTANEFPEAIAICLAAGCDGHLSKPIDAAKLLTVLNEIFFT